MNPLPIVFIVLSAFLTEMVPSKPQKLPTKKGWTCGQRNVSKNFKIVGGQMVPIESQPWMATIFYNSGKKFFCGGSLIHPCWVLTAAHCFLFGRANKSKLIIRLGRSAINAPNANNQEFSVEKLIINKAFAQPIRNFSHDIALIKIRSRAGKCAKQSNIVKTICLPSKKLILGEGSSCEVAGYGKENKFFLPEEPSRTPETCRRLHPCFEAHSLRENFAGSQFTIANDQQCEGEVSCTFTHSAAIFYSEVLKSADVQLVSHPACKSSYKNKKVTDNMVCASHSEWRADSCTADSGGPLSCMSDGRIVLYGIVSWGDGCAKKGRPGVYTSVTKQVVWIKSTMKREKQKQNDPVPTLK